MIHACRYKITALKMVTLASVQSDTALTAYILTTLKGAPPYSTLSLFHFLTSLSPSDKSPPIHPTSSLSLSLSHVLLHPSSTQPLSLVSLCQGGLPDYYGCCHGSKGGWVCVCVCMSAGEQVLNLFTLTEAISKLKTEYTC